MILLHLFPDFFLHNSKYNHLISFKDNEIRLKVKGIGSYPILYSSFSYNPTTIYLNEAPITSNKIINLNNSINYVRLIFSSALPTCKSMFRGCSQIIEIDLTDFISSNVGNIDYMFYGCTSLKSIKFGNFQTSKLDIMEYVFQNCESLETLNLSSFDTSSVTDFHYMFAGCKSLKYLDLSNFRTSSCICTFYMFTNCTSLTSINLTSFDTSKVTLMYNMFYNCKSLTSLDLSSFDTSSCTQMQNMFNGCEKLEYVNMEKALISSNLVYYENMISNTPKNIVFCVTESKTPILSGLMTGNTCSIKISNCSSDYWRLSQKKLLPDLSSCIENCSLSSFPFEYLGKCYSICQNGTAKINNKCIECNSDCKNCDINNISFCKSCKDPNKFLNNGTCLTSCSYGYYTDEDNNKVCCSLEKCSQCTKESLNQGLCLACNDGYYPKYNKQIKEGDYFDCYQNLKGYYLDKSDPKFNFKECYSTCQTCNEGGNNIYNNCTQCKSNLNFEIEFNPYKNCYEKCKYYYFLDVNNQIHCTNYLNCTKEYDKLIEEKGQCLKKCEEDSKYKYEFRKKCFEECPEGTRKNQFFCEIICTKESPFEIIPYQNCVSFCGINDWKQGLCRSNYQDEETNAKLILDNILQDLIINKYSSFSLNENENIIIKEKWATFSLLKAKNNNKDIIDIINCENILKKYYNIPSNKYFYVLMININKYSNEIPKID